VGNEQRFYIATQTPLPSTVNHFWQMVWEAGVHLVLDLSLPKINTIDENYGKYFPTVADHSVQFGEVSILIFHPLLIINTYYSKKLNLSTLILVSCVATVYARDWSLRY